MSNKVVFIGGGNMAEALLRGTLAAKVFKAADVVVTDVQNDRLQYLEKAYKVKTSTKNVNSAADANIVVLSIKPQNMEVVIEEIESVIDSKKLVISIAAGVTIKSLQKKADWKIVRVMPNTPALIGKGISALCAGDNVKKADKDVVENIFNAVGKVLWVEEKDMNAVTAVSGSGPAFVYRLQEAMMVGAKKAGLAEPVAKELVEQTFIGASEMLAASSEGPTRLVQKVASPGGTTEAGLKVQTEVIFIITPRII